MASWPHGAEWTQQSFSLQFWWNVNCIFIHGMSAAWTINWYCTSFSLVCAPSRAMSISIWMRFLGMMMMIGCMNCWLPIGLFLDSTACYIWQIPVGVSQWKCLLIFILNHSLDDESYCNIIKTNKTNKRQFTFPCICDQIILRILRLHFPGSTVVQFPTLARLWHSIRVRIHLMVTKNMNGMLTSGCRNPRN